MISMSTGAALMLIVALPFVGLLQWKLIKLFVLVWLAHRNRKEKAHDRD